ncbi:MAG: stage II sporulation protein P [Bacillota bacterium]|jgi:stage II sporulation protein P|nr:stage II sporulation protein P [Bacillota bacterium]NLJ03153.1 stage II sporulation protein P [Bacillota bacterium]
MSRRLFALLICPAILLMLLCPMSRAEEVWGEFLPAGEYYQVLDPEGQVLMETGRFVYLQDQYLAADNKLYEIIDIDEDRRVARTKFVEDEKLEVFPWHDLRKELGLTVIEASDEGGKGMIAIYHTHNAESYVPTDGADSINGKGGIHQVGSAFADALEKLGVNVDYSEALHLPHDRGAYRRSRETVLELLSASPDAIFDVHRDAAPQSAYALQLQDEWVTRVMFVVGRQNQNLGVNRKYAQSLKAIADELYPGLVKGIFFGRGNYNQDLSPLSLLIEVGAHTNSREAAEKGVSLFAEVVNHYFYGPVAEAADGQRQGAALRSIAGVLTFTVALSLVIYLLNKGGFGPILERLRRFAGRRRLK